MVLPGNCLPRPIAGLLALILATSLYARGQFWDFLGSAQVDGSRDHGRIQIVRRDRVFRTIQLRVSGEAIFFDRLVVHFGDGTSQERIISGRLLGGSNYVIELPGERALESVELWYFKEPWGSTPKVSVYGIPLPAADASAKTETQALATAGMSLSF
jgi:hypothetical protein